MIKDYQSSAFSYRQGNSFLHKSPSWIKILLIPIISILFFSLPPFFSLILLIVQTILAFYLHFPIKEQLRDLRAVIYYAIFLEIAHLAGIIGQGISIQNSSDLLTLLLDKESLFMLIKLLTIMQTASLIFKTSTSLQLREGLEIIERFVRGLFTRLAPAKTPIAQAVSLFICFIPLVSKNWNQCRRAWTARGGRTGLRMYLALLPVLFSVGMKQAYNTARALSIRTPSQI